MKKKYNLIKRSSDWIVISLVRVIVVLTHPIMVIWHLKRDPSFPFINPADPRTLNEKFFWRKIFDHNPVFPLVCDKLALRDWIDESGVDVALPEIYWTGKDASDIPYDVLANGTAIKANHGSGTNLFVEDAPEDRDKLNRQANAFLHVDNGKRAGEWSYTEVERELFAEELLRGRLLEYQFFTFGAHIQRVILIMDRFEEGISGDVWTPGADGNFERNVDGGLDSVPHSNLPLPAQFEEASKIARQLGKDFDHVRVDLNWDGVQLWLGELTLYHLGGYLPRIGHLPDDPINESWDLGKSWFMSTPQSGWRGVYQSALRRRLKTREHLPC
ncbi:MAG: hypothetical protein GKR98_12500 [Boseongicola sp.]|nr:MAG: hypothetical protein GKR98_12500 [Boseongicola sp.]